MPRSLLPVVLCAAGLAVSASARSQVEVPHAGLVIDHSVRFQAGEFAIPAPGDDTGPGAIRIHGDNLTVDFGGAVLRGTPPTAEPDARTGVGIEVEGRNITLRGASVHGYKVGLRARNAPGLRILDSDFSYNWKPHLGSTLEREDGADWMSYHQNEKDEWLRYGAGVYLRDCDGFEVRNTRVEGGANGLLLTSCNRGLVWNSDFSFLSALGLGMYRCSDNRVMHNNIDWCVRGYSHGVYNRGQDSAGILVYEQSNRNTFAYNSVTHGGDGFFLWAGQTTMDTGQGGCNDNLLYGNDWSHAPTNGIEATFSRNRFVNNKILECWHGIWGGYGYETQVIGNVFGLNAEAIAWEHGQDNRVERNVFYRDNAEMVIWSNPTQDPNWGYPKNHDTRSRDWLIRDNVFSNTVTDALNVRRTAKVEIRDNHFDHVGRVLRTGEAAERVSTATNAVRVASLDAGLRVPSNEVTVEPQFTPAPATMNPDGNTILALDPETRDYLARFQVPWSPWPGREPRPANHPLAGAVADAEAAAESLAPKPLRGGKYPFLKPGTLRGRRYILVDQWGPYDFRSPLLWPRETSRTGNARRRRFEILGPKGRWHVVAREGVAAVSAESGVVPGFVDVDLPAGKPGLTRLTLEYVGGKTVDYRGVPTSAGTPVRFGYEKFFAPIDWNVRFYTWTKSVDTANENAVPDEAALRRILAGPPVHQMKTDTLDFASGGAFYPDGPTDKFATVAEGAFEIPPGDYTLETTTDDGMRVWVDGKLVIDAWKYQGPTPYTADLHLGGHHTIRVEHFEIGGYAALKVALRPKQ